jgi:hypothetical protein
MDNIYNKIGFASSNEAFMKNVEVDIRKEHPEWSKAQIIDEMEVRLKAYTLFHDKNKKAKRFGTKNSRGKSV